PGNWVSETGSLETASSSGESADRWSLARGRIGVKTCRGARSSLLIWIVAVADAQEPCRKLESLGPEPRHLFEDPAGAERTVRLTVTDNAPRQSFADAGDARQQRRRRR